VGRSEANFRPPLNDCSPTLESSHEIIVAWIAEILAKYPGDPAQASRAIFDEVFLPLANEADRFGNPDLED
jgi:hypothetical protein